MIRINLIPPELIIKKEEARQRSKIYFFLFLLILALALLSLFQYQRLGKIKKEIAKLDQAIDKITPEVKKAVEVKKESENLRKEVRTLAKLVKEQPFFSRTMDELSNILPENIWLTRLSLDKQDLRISGTTSAAFRAEVYDFVPRLENSLYFKEVQPPHTDQGKIEEKEVINFNINCKNESSF
jgi:Tfp pilus assembly protein PilN